MQQKSTTLFDKQIHRDEFRLRILVTNGCNKKCIYCLNDFQPKPNTVATEINLSDVKEAVRAYRTIISKYDRKQLISISGGEPGTHKELPNILSIASEPNAKIMLNTNGLAISSFQKSIERNNVHVRVHLEKINHRLLKFIKRNNCRIVYVLTNSQIKEDIERFVDFYAMHNLQIKLYRDFYEKDNNTIQRLLSIIQYLHDKYPRHVLSRFTGIQENRGPGCNDCPNTCLTLKALWIFPDGGASPCPQGRFPVQYPKGNKEWLCIMESAFHFHNLKI